MLTQELVKISRRFIDRVKFTSQDLDHFSHTSGSGVYVICIPFLISSHNSKKFSQNAMVRLNLARFSSQAPANVCVLKKILEIFLEYQMHLKNFDIYWV